jgi:hypothetical protein
MWMRPHLQRSLQRTNNRPELMMADANHDSATVMGPTELQPSTAYAREVGRVERHQDALLSAGELQQLLVGTTIQVAFFGDRQHVVPAVSQGRTDPSTRDVRIQQ